MINLLPEDTKKQIRSARANTILFSCLIILFIAVAFLILACSSTYLLLNSVKADSEKAVTEASSGTTLYAQFNSQADIIRSNLLTARGILDQQISYSDIITKIATALPSGIILDSLSISKNTLGTPITLQLYANSTDNISKIKDGFQSPPFSNYNLQETKTDSGGPNGYTTKIAITVTIDKGIAQ